MRVKRPALKWRIHKALPSACICVSLDFPVCATGSPRCPALVWIISCPALAAGVCAPWIYDGDGWPGLGGDVVCLCVGMCQWSQGRHGCTTNEGDTRLFTAGWTTVMDMEIRQCLGNKSLRICVSLEVCACVCVITNGCALQYGILFMLLLQGQDYIFVIHYFSSLLIQTLIFCKKHICLNVIAHTFYLLCSEQNWKALPTPPLLWLILFFIFTVLHSAIQRWNLTAIGCRSMGDRW